MEAFSKINPAFFREVEDEAIGLKGYLVIDNHTNGAATGGIRMATDVSLEEIANLAHEMSFKYGLLSIKKDGAKAGIVAPASLSREKKKTLCRAFGKEIGDLIREKKYFPGEDLGIMGEDLAEIFVGAGLQIQSQDQGIKSEYFTAMTVFITIKEILRSVDKKIENTSFLIEGFGKVAIRLAEMLLGVNAKIVGLSTVKGAIYDPLGLDIRKTLDLKKELSDSFIYAFESSKQIPKEDLILQEADVFVPGARPDSIRKDNAQDIKAKLIVPIANIPATEETEHILFNMGKFYVPGFVSNCGGILGYFLSEQGFGPKTVESIIQRGFPLKVRKIISLARDKKLSIAQVARKLSEDNITTMKLRNKHPFWKKVNFSNIMWMLYKSLLKIRMEFLLKPFALRYIEKKHFS